MNDYEFLVFLLFVAIVWLLTIWRIWDTCECSLLGPGKSLSPEEGPFLYSVRVHTYFRAQDERAAVVERFPFPKNQGQFYCSCTTSDNGLYTTRLEEIWMPLNVVLFFISLGLGVVVAVLGFPKQLNRLIDCLQ